MDTIPRLRLKFRRRRYLLYLSPLTYERFRHACRDWGKRPNRVVEAFMAAVVDNPALLILTLRMAEKAYSSSKSTPAAASKTRSAPSSGPSPERGEGRGG